MQISVAARLVGVPAHALRHWEDEGVLVPPRDSRGHRSYDDELVARGRLVVLLQATGLSLRAIGGLATADRSTRVAAVARHRERIGAHRDRLATADAFLAHSLECRHATVTECPACSGYAQALRADR